MYYFIQVNLSISVLLFFGFGLNSQSIMQVDLQTPFEKNTNHSASYLEVISYYENLGNISENISVQPFGMTDAGYPLHEIIISNDGIFDPIKIREKGKTILFINNGIHPGEPCGIDASMALARDLILENQILLNKLTIVLVPIYNIGGALNRGSHSRANQKGPEAYGFRGNAQNLDLNRDFIKCDSKNAKSFNQLFSKWNPEVFIDTHTSNGADYQYTMTLIATQKDKLGGPLADYLNDHLLPAQYKHMENAGWEMTPYVYARETPDEGIAGFLDLPRYSSGYAALKNSVSYMPETHMLKSFEARVNSTYAFLYHTIEILADQHAIVQKAAKDHQLFLQSQRSFPIQWKLSFDNPVTVLFKGYEAAYKASAISGQSRLYYDQNKPYEKRIPFFNDYTTELDIDKPKMYVIPQAYDRVIERLKWNGVEMRILEEDTGFEAEMYYITDYETSKSPFEGHYLHSDVQVIKKDFKKVFRKGDVIVRTDQPNVRYIIETLEPQSADSFFAWNFFDGILMQKEHFSSYVFEDSAEEILKQNPEIKVELEAEKAKNAKLKESGRAQLDFIYKRSSHYEYTHNLYPVARIK